MGNFNRGFSKQSFSANRDNRGGGRDSRDSGGYRGGRDSGRSSYSNDREMHDATCSSCGKSCQVPFRPTGAKPVFCSDCFRNQNSRESSPRRYEDRGERPAQSERPQSNEQFDALNVKLDKILSILENVTTEEAVMDNQIVEVVEELEVKPAQEIAEKTPKTRTSKKK